MKKWGLFKECKDQKKSIKKLLKLVGEFSKVACMIQGKNAIY